MKAAAPGTLLLDCSTIDPAVSRELACQAEGLKVHYWRVRAARCVHVVADPCAGPSLQLRMCDAPVSGGIGGAAAGTLTFMVGGRYRACSAVAPSRACRG
jgi:3-hydroxyisobutyrate dehydrogenase